MAIDSAETIGLETCGKGEVDALMHIICIIMAVAADVSQACELPNIHIINDYLTNSGLNIHKLSST